MKGRLHHASIETLQEKRQEGGRMGNRILIVEDEAEIAELLAAYLTRAGHEVARASTVQDAIRTHASAKPDLVLLDIGLPGGGDGIDVLTTIRRRFDTPVIMVTAREDDVTKLSSLRVGADDYVVKPFNPSEVVERVRAVLRRAHGSTDRRILNVDQLSIDLDARIVICRAGRMAEEKIDLTPTEFELLAFMARHPRRAFSRSELLEAVAPDSSAYDRVVDSHLSKLRQKLAAVGCAQMIEPVRGVGYRLWSS